MNYHPDIELLFKYANGQIAPALSIAIGLHHQQCEQCQQQIADIESIAGDNVEQLKNSTLADASFDKLMEQLDCQQNEVSDVPATSNQSSQNKAQLQQDGIKEYLNLAVAETDLNLIKQLHQQDFSLTHWKNLTPNIAQSKIDFDESSYQLELLKFKPHGKTPKHTHRGNEFTVVIQGSFSDHLGEYQQGDFIAMNNSNEHQPVAGVDGCICFAVTDKPLKFTGLLGPIINWATR